MKVITAVNKRKRHVPFRGVKVFALTVIYVREITAPVVDLASWTDRKCTSLSEVGLGIKLRSKPAIYRRGKIRL
jgi:hypothetical protein